MKNYAKAIAPLSVATFLLLTALGNAIAMAIVAAIASGAVGLIVLRRCHPVTSLAIGSGLEFIDDEAAGVVELGVGLWSTETGKAFHLNRLIEKLAAIKSDLRQIRLSHLKEPNGLGWVTHVPKGNGIPVIFSIGDQARIDEWFKRVRKPFGVMEFTATPEAVPPTLTIFIQNKVVKLDELKIPEGIDVLAGYVPTVFHKFNTTIEQKNAKESATTTDSKSQNNELDDSSLAAIKKVEAFLESQKNRTKP